MKWIIGFTLLIVFIGTVLGLSLSGLNPWTNPAQARQIDLQTNYQAQKNDLALQEEQNRMAAEAKQAEQNLIQDQENHAQALRNSQRFADAGSIMVIVFGGALSIGVIILAIRKAFSRKGNFIPVEPVKVLEEPNLRTTYIRPLPVRQPYDPWNNPGYRESMIKQARDNEIQTRRINKVCKSNPSSSSGYNRLPRAS
jgi:hypothetical protein